KRRLRNSFCLRTLIASLALIPTVPVTAQTFTTLLSFNSNNGAYPSAGLIISGNTLYGTTYGKTNGGNSTVFAINTDGTGFTNLHRFTTPSNGTNSDGVNPSCTLVLSGNTLYGTTVRGGSSGNGTVFALSTDGTGFTNLHS